MSTREEMDFSNRDFCGAIIQYPDTTGKVYDLAEIIDSAHANGVSHSSCNCLMFLYAMGS